MAEGRISTSSEAADAQSSRWRRPDGILLVHNRYKHPGGEDFVFEAERDLLMAHGHRVQSFEVENARITESPGGKLRSAAAAVFGGRELEELRDVLQEGTFDICHFYNTFPLISPNAYRLCRRHGVPVVQTVQNYRLICPGALLFRDGEVCEECVGRRLHWPGVIHRCYRGSALGSAVVASMVGVHRAIGSFEYVDRFVAATEFSRDRLIAGGLDADRLVVKPNFVEPPKGKRWRGGDRVLFVGRLAPGKGLHTLLTAWQHLDLGTQLVVAGDGPLRDELRRRVHAERMRDVQFLGWVDQTQVDDLMRSSSVLVVPSEWYEGFPTTIAKALGLGVPVIGTDLGGVGEILTGVDPGSVFPAGDDRALASLLKRVVGSRRAQERLSNQGLRAYHARYTPERNYEALMKIYSSCPVT